MRFIAILGGFVWLLVVFGCKRGPEGPVGPAGPTGPAGPAGPDYIPPNSQGYIRGILIAQDTFNRQRVRESYNYIYYFDSPARVYTFPSNIIRINIDRSGNPLSGWFGEAYVSLEVDTTTSPFTIRYAEATLYYSKQMGNNLLVYSNTNPFSLNDSQDTLLIESLTISPQLTQVQGRLRGVRRDVTPPDTVTFEFESVIPQEYR